MASPLKLKFRKLTISNANSPKCANKDCGECPVRSTRMLPKHDFKSTVKSTIEADISIRSEAGKRVTHNIRATGGYSDVHLALMYGKTRNGKLYTHWGLILQQQKTWVLDGKSGQCILFHHMGDGVEIMVGCLSCLRNAVRGVYGSQVADPKLTFFYAGRSRAAVERFLNGQSLGRNVDFEYNSEYRHGKSYYDFGETNCCRLVFDLLKYLTFRYSLAVQIDNYNGNEHWDEVFMSIYKEYPDFCKNILEFYGRLKKDRGLQKVLTLINGQFNLESAYQKYIKLTSLSGLGSAFASLFV